MEKTGVENLPLKWWCINFTPFDYMRYNMNTYFIDVMKIIPLVAKHGSHTQFSPNVFCQENTYSLLMHSSYIIFKLLLLDLLMHLPNTTLYYGTNIWKTFINKGSDLR